MRFTRPRAVFVALIFITLSLGKTVAQPTRRSTSEPPDTLLRIIRAEDERRWDNTLPVLFLDQNPVVRKRAALAMGRIGNTEALPALVEVLKTERDHNVRQMIVFAMGEIESPESAMGLIEILDDVRTPSEVRARAIEALGKIGAIILNDTPTADSPQGRQLTKIRFAILDALRFEAGRRSAPDRLSILLGLTAVLRTKPDGAGPIIERFLSYSDPRIVADALNALARLRLKDGNIEARELLVKSSDPIVRTNAARVLGATEDKQSYDALLDRALQDDDLRVRVSAIRAVGALKDPQATEALMAKGASLAEQFKADRAKEIAAHPRSQNELLEVAAALGRVIPSLHTMATQPNEKRTVAFFTELRTVVYGSAPEIEIGFARTAPFDYVASFRKYELTYVGGQLPRIDRGVAQGLQEIASLKTEQDAQSLNEIKQSAEALLAKWLIVLMSRPNSLGQLQLSEVLRAYAALKSARLNEVLRQNLNVKDVIVRATAAELLADSTSNSENSRALSEALKVELPLTEKGEMNDAALAILDALAKQKSDEANAAIKTALDSSDHLIRRKAVALLKANGAGDFSNRIGTVKTRNTEADYHRAIDRIGKHVTVTVETSKGSFVIEFLSEDAPLTVDNFVQLAKKGFFNGQAIPRVVPNFVIQAGDPRGDTNGGPGYQIRCEINEVPYERAAVGMALSGKDTGGSQWFVTHSPQPHLDGGYTVFGHVISGMEVVDNIARGDVIRKVTVSER